MGKKLQMILFLSIVIFEIYFFISVLIMIYLFKKKIKFNSLKIIIFRMHIFITFYYFIWHYKIDYLYFLNNFSL